MARRLTLSIPFLGRPSRQTNRASAEDEAFAVSADVARRVRDIEVRTRRLATSMVAGEYRSIFRGSGIEFAEAREYVPGDDVRFIDWNVTARMSEPWVKEFVEERELTVVVAVDRSASSLVARPRAGRMEAAAQLTALLGFAAAQNHDRTGLLTFSEGIDTFVAPRRGARHVLRLVRDVLSDDEPTGRTTNITAAAEYLGRVLRRRSAVFIASDFFDEGYEMALQALSRRHEVVALTLVDPLDLELPDLGLIEVEAAEQGQRLLLDTSDRRVRERYAEAARERAEARRRALTLAGVDEIEIRLDEDPITPLARYFHRRAFQS